MSQAEQIIAFDKLRKRCERLKKAKALEGPAGDDFFEPAIPLPEK